MASSMFGSLGGRRGLSGRLCNGLGLGMLQDLVSGGSFSRKGGGL